MDIKAILALNVIETRYLDLHLPPAEEYKESWKCFVEGIYEIGSDEKGFAFDNEKPRHKNYMYPFEIRSPIVTNGEYLSFIESKGYNEAKFWLSLGWDWVQTTLAQSPLYWRQRKDQWFEYTLYGEIPLDPNAPVVHINYFEADAFARWRGLRLPTEQEIEVFLATSKKPNDISLFHPIDANASSGQVWCWTKSAYSAYPGFETFAGSLEEYNGKFMCNQNGFTRRMRSDPKKTITLFPIVIFYLPEQRWMFSGLRLARNTK